MAAGLSFREIRAILRGDPPTETPNPRPKVHTLSFLLHLRPRAFQRDALRFGNTFHLGFFAVFLLAVELLSGLVLMVYYRPTPEKAYPSILYIMGQVPFGALLRDIHRLAAEALVVCAVLHLLRVFISGAYQDRRRFTWVLGVGLLVCTLGFAFTGYLRPWDQRAYWAVTIGTSMIESVPLVGDSLSLLVRGGPDIGAGGLLRFNLLHIVALPLATALLLGAHYYRISRLHGIALPRTPEPVPEPGSEPGSKPGSKPGSEPAGARRRAPFVPDVLSREILLSCAGLLVLVVVALFFYDAPLEHHADPRQTPLDTQAPWFFLWLQGLLKLGNKTLMGIVVPLLFLGLLLALPYIDRTPQPGRARRPLAVVAVLVAVAGFMALSYLGTHHYGIQLPAAQRIAQDLAPLEGAGPLHRIPFDHLPVGIYDIDQTDIEILPPSLGELFSRLKGQVQRAVEQGELAAASAVLMVEEWQADLKRITLRIAWEAPEGQGRKSFERVVPLHRER